MNSLHSNIIDIIRISSMQFLTGMSIEVLVSKRAFRELEIKSMECWYSRLSGRTVKIGIDVALFYFQVVQ